MAEGKTAIVTGASSGVGRATSILLAEAGYDLALVARREEELRKTAELAAERAGEEGQKIEIVIESVDISRAEPCRRLIESVGSRLGRIDALANVAGAAPRLSIESITQDIWQRCVDTNLSAVVHLTAAAWPIFRRQGGATIVNVSSLASVDPFPGFSIYASAKAGVNMFTRCTAREGAEIGVRAVAVATGAIETPMLRELFDESVIPKAMTLSAMEVAGVIRDCITGRREFEPGETIVLASPA